MRFTAWLVVSCALFAGAQDAPIPVDQEPRHKLVLKNDYVEVLHLSLPAGERTLYHTHAHDRASIDLSETTLTQQSFGGAEGAPDPTEPRIPEIRTVDQPYSHRVHNVGQTSYEVVDFEFLKRPPQAGPAAAGAPLAGENASVRAYRYVLKPGEKSVQHTHERPYLIVATTDLQLKMSAPDGQSVTHPVKAGEFHWVDSKVTHTLENTGSAGGEIVEFEMK